ncbi:MAG: hypothetical protein ACLSGK_07555 [Lachnospiraceae bacterium]
MATSSITHNFVVSNPNSVKRFWSRAIDVKPTVTAHQSRHLPDVINEPTGNLSFTPSKRKKNMSG